MGKTHGKKAKRSGSFLAFLIIALLFLLVGVGTLGSFSTTGDAYELKASRSGDAQAFNVTFRLKNTDAESGETAYYRVASIWLNTASVYTEVGVPAGVKVSWSSDSANYFDLTSRTRNGVLENVYTDPDAPEDAAAPTATDVLFNWVAPFDLANVDWYIYNYPYVRLSAPDASLLLNEIVFVGEKLTSGTGTGLGEYRVIPAEVVSATPVVNETNEQARARAAALLDAQRMPVVSQSSFFRFTDEEVYTLMTLAEMRMGNAYIGDETGNATNVYHGDRIYNTLGTSIVALGTAIFGMSPFGLRIFPMLASFGVLVVGYFFVKRLAKSEKAGLAFAVLYALCGIAISLGHLGTPLMIGVFFLVASLSLCHKFYAEGMKKANFVSALPLLFSGLFGAAAICVNGAFVVPVAGICALFVLGMLRQQRARRYRLDLAIAEAEAEEAQAPAHPEESGEAEPVGEGRKKVLGVLREYRYKDTAGGVCFAAGLLFGAFLLSLLFMIPVYFALVKIYDNPAAPTLNLFTLGWKAFAGGFVGVNELGYSQSAWSVFYRLFEGTGAVHAVTAVVMNVAAALAAVVGVGFAIWRLVAVLRAKEKGRAERTELRRVLVPLAGLVLSLVTAAFAKGALAFLLLAYVFAFALASVGFVRTADAVRDKHAKALRACTGVAIALLVAMFLLFAVFTFSIPLPDAFLGSILG